MSIEELSREISTAVKERKANLTRELRKHQINPRTFYDWSSGKKAPTGENLEKLQELHKTYATKKEAA